MVLRECRICPLIQIILICDLVDSVCYVNGNILLIQEIKVLKLQLSPPLTLINNDLQLPYLSGALCTAKLGLYLYGSVALHLPILE